MDENTLVSFLFQKGIEKVANLSTYLFVFICSSSATIVATPNSKLWIRWIKIFWWIICFRNVSKKVANLTEYFCAFICSSSVTIVTSPSSKLRMIWMKIYWWFLLFHKCIELISCVEFYEIMKINVLKKK